MQVTQTLWLVSQMGVAGLALQSESARHATHWWDEVSQT